MTCDLWGVAIGGLIGFLSSIGAAYATHRFSTSKQDKNDSDRKKLLFKMLEDAKGKGWRRIDTLSRVIGADEPTTKRLLIEIGARGNQRNNDVWTLISRHPLPTRQNQDDDEDGNDG